MYNLLITVLTLSTSKLVSADRKMTIDNQCSGTIYPAFQGQGGSPTTSDGNAQPAGWEQVPGTYSFNVPDGWNTARIWARTGCTGSGSSLTCVIGGCASGNNLACTGNEAGGPGATLAEFTLGNLDSYDVSIVDGFNLPMEIKPSTSSCTKATCGTEIDILTECDPNLVYPKSSDKIHSCASPCLNSIQFQDGTSGSIVSADPSNSLVCCVMGGTAVSHTDCPNTYIPYYSVMKSMCSGGYVYADDDMYENAVFSCGDATDYTITFCPGGKGSGVSPLDSSSAKTQSTEAGNNAGNLLDGSSSGSASVSATGSSGIVTNTINNSGTGKGTTGAVETATSVSLGTTNQGSATSQIASSISIAATSNSAVATSTGRGGNRHHTHSNGGGGGVAAFQESWSSSASITPAPAATSNLDSVSILYTVGVPEPGTTTYTSAGNVYVEVIEYTAVRKDVITIPTTKATVREVAERDVGCMKGKRWIGERQIDCTA